MAEKPPTAEALSQKKQIEMLEARVKELLAEKEQDADDELAAGLLAEAAGQGTIHDRLARVGEHLKYVRRGGHMRSSQANFTYATIDQLRAAVRPLLAQEGITMVPAEIDVMREAERTSKNGNAQFDTVLRVLWRFACSYRPEAGEGKVAVPTFFADLQGLAWIHVPSFGRSLNSSDKDYNTAMTYAERNALLSVFHLESGDDPEQDRPEAAPQTAPRANTRAPADYGRMGPPPSRRAAPPTDEQRGEAARIRIALAPFVGGEDVVNGWVSRFIEGEWPEQKAVDLNRDQFEVLLDGLRGLVKKEQEAGRLVGFDPKTGEVAAPPPAAAAAPPPAAAAAGDTPPVEGPPPATPEAPMGEASPEVQQQIEQAAAEAAKPATGQNPDAPAGSAWEDAKQAVADAGLGEADFLSLAMEAGAALPADFDKTEVVQRFQDALAKKIGGAK